MGTLTAEGGTGRREQRFDRDWLLRSLVFTVSVVAIVLGASSGFVMPLFVVAFTMPILKRWAWASPTLALGGLITAIAVLAYADERLVPSTGNLGPISYWLDQIAIVEYALATVSFIALALVGIALWGVRLKAVAIGILFLSGFVIDAAFVLREGFAQANEGMIARVREKGVVANIRLKIAIDAFQKGYGDLSDVRHAWVELRMSRGMDPDPALASDEAFKVMFADPNWQKPYLQRSESRLAADMPRIFEKPAMIDMLKSAVTGEAPVAREIRTIAEWETAMAGYGQRKAEGKK